MNQRTLVCGLAALLLGGCLSPDHVALRAEADGGPAQGCRHETCSGCCYLGECVTGYLNDACGMMGHRCEICANSEFCTPARECKERPPDAGPTQEWIPYSAPSEEPGSDTEINNESDRKCYAIAGIWACP